MYLDGTHSGWLNVHDVSTRLIQAGVEDTEGFFLNPEWGGIVDPAAGEWFPQQALQLALLANPPLIG